MNAALVPAGYAWTTIRVDTRAAYMAALDAAAADGDIRPFAAHVLAEMAADP